MDDQMKADEGEQGSQEDEPLDGVEDMDVVEEDSADVTGGGSRGGVPLNKPVIGM